jgi:hypothetical protein
MTATCCPTCGQSLPGNGDAIGAKLKSLKAARVAAGVVVSVTGIVDEAGAALLLDRAPDGASATASVPAPQQAEASEDREQREAVAARMIALAESMRGRTAAAHRALEVQPWEKDKRK